MDGIASLATEFKVLGNWEKNTPGDIRISVDDLKDLDIVGC